MTQTQKEKLIKLVKEYRKKGMSYDKIAKELVKKGYDPDTMERLFPEEKKPLTKQDITSAVMFGVLKAITIIIILILLFGCAIRVIIKPI